MQKHSFIGALLGIVVVLLGLSSCNNVEKLLKNPDYGLKYREANRYFELGAYHKAVLLYENVYPFYRSTAQDDTVNIQIARCYYRMQDAEMAEYYYGYFRDNFARSPFIEEADFYVALSAYDQSLRPDLDQTKTRDAIQLFDSYLYKYPRSERNLEINEKLVELHLRLEDKDINSAKLYLKTEYYTAAVVALRNCLRDYPDTQQREELLFLVLKSTYLHAENSVYKRQRDRFQKTIDEYLNLVSEFPNSKYKREADRIYARSLQKTRI